jgi:xanthine dehydrogenase/oxidase
MLVDKRGGNDIHCELQGLVKAEEKSATQIFHKEPLKGSQLFEIIKSGQAEHDPLKRPLKHKSADKQATGEAVYVDDIPRMAKELHLGFVLSDHAHAKVRVIIVGKKS